jgi:hypothetical protein
MYLIDAPGATSGAALGVAVPARNFRLIPAMMSVKPAAAPAGHAPQQEELA